MLVRSCLRNAGKDEPEEYTSKDLSLWACGLRQFVECTFQRLRPDLSKIKGFGLYRAQEFRMPNQGRLFRMWNSISGGWRQHSAPQFHIFRSETLNSYKPLVE